MQNILWRPHFLSGRIKVLLLRRINDYFGDAFGNASAAFRQAAAAAAVEEETAILPLLRPFSIAAAAVEEIAVPQLKAVDELRHCLLQRFYCGAAVVAEPAFRALLYGPIFCILTSDLQHDRLYMHY